MIKILGGLDLITALSFWVFAIFNITALSQIVLFLGIALLIKGIIFATTLNITSILDVISAVVIITGSSFNLHNLIVSIIAIYLIQKGVLSLVG